MISILHNTPVICHGVIFRGDQCIRHLNRYMATVGLETGIGAETALGSDFTAITLPLASWMSSSATSCLMKDQDCAKLEQGGGRGTEFKELSFLLFVFGVSPDWILHSDIELLFSL